jgi:hypothetical protein
MLWLTRSSGSLEDVQLTVAQLVKNLPVFYRIWFITVFTINRLWSLSLAWSVHSTDFTNLKTIWILTSHLRLCLPSQFSEWNCAAFFFFPLCSASHHPLFCHFCITSSIVGNYPQLEFALHLWMFFRFNLICFSAMSQFSKHLTRCICAKLRIQQQPNLT